MASIPIRFRTGPKNSNSIAPSRPGTGKPATQDGIVLHSRPGAERITWEHGKRNFLLRTRGLLPIVCTISDGSDLSGIGIFNACRLINP